MSRPAYRTRQEGFSPIQDARLSRGWTQAELAARVGVSAGTVKNIERGLAVGLTAVLAVRYALGLPFPRGNHEGKGKTLKKSIEQPDNLSLFD